MSDETKKRRREWLRELNFGGTTDWAVDLATHHDGPQREGDWNIEIDSLECDDSIWPSTLDDFDSRIDQIPVHCRGMAMTGYFTDALGDAIAQYTEVSKGYDDKVRTHQDQFCRGINNELVRLLH